MEKTCFRIVTAILILCLLVDSIQASSALEGHSRLISFCSNSAVLFTEQALSVRAVNVGKHPPTTIDEYRLISSSPQQSIQRSSLRTTVLEVWTKTHRTAVWLLRNALIAPVGMTLGVGGGAFFLPPATQGQLSGTIPDQNTLEELLKLLTAYDGNASTVNGFLSDLERQDSNLSTRMGKDRTSQQETLLKALASEKAVQMVDQFSPAAMRFISELRSRAILRNWATDDPEHRQLGNLYLEGSRALWGLGHVLGFYHPITNVRYSVQTPIRADDHDHISFLIFAEHPTGSVLIGTASGTCRHDDLKVNGDVPSELQTMLRFILLHTDTNTEYSGSAGFSYDNGRNESDSSHTFCFARSRDYRWDEKEIRANFYRGPNGRIELSFGNDRKRINLTPTTHNDAHVPERELLSAPERELFWNNKWLNSNVNYRGMIPKLLEDLEANKTLGQRVLEIGGGNDPATSRMFKQKQIVSIDLGAPEDPTREENTLFVQGDAEHLSVLATSKVSSIAEFLGGEPKTAESGWLSWFDTVVISNVFNYVDARRVTQQLAEGLAPGTSILVQNDVDQGHTAAFSPNGVKSNGDLIDAFSSEYFEIKAIYGYVPRGGKDPMVIELHKEPAELVQLSRQQAEQFKGTLYLVLERRQQADHLKGTPSETRVSDLNLGLHIRTALAVMALPLFLLASWAGTANAIVVNELMTIRSNRESIRTIQPAIFDSYPLRAA